MATLKLAVMSDLHIGPGARGEDLCPFSDSKNRDAAFLQTFFQLVDRALLYADYLIIPGDISDRAHPHEYQLASDVIEQVANRLTVSIDHIVAIPGNHDVNWAISRSHADDKTGMIKGLRFSPMGHPEWILSRLIREADQSLVKDPYFITRRIENVLFAAYNSACEDNYDLDPHYGITKQEHLIRLRSHLQSFRYDPQVVRIFVVHHHPMQYSDPRANQPDFSEMTNAEGLRTLLDDFKFDLLIHGHKHVPKFNVSMMNSGHPVAILGAGSFSRDLDSSWTGLVANQFHVIEVEDRDPNTGYARGRVRSWAYTISGWCPSDGWAGIPHVRPFGSVVSAPALESKIETFLLQRASETLIEVSDMFNLYPELKFLFPEYIQQTLVSLLPRHKLELVFRPTNELTTAMLVRLNTP